VANGDLRLSIPGAGRTIASSAEERAVFVREAVDIIRKALTGREIRAEFDAVYGTRWEPGDTGATSESVASRAAWILTNVWMSASLSGAVSQGASIADAEVWFFGEFRDHLPSLARLLNVDANHHLVKSLGKIRCDSDLLDLLPYVLEPHGPGSRLTVMRNPNTLHAWNAKRDSGVFYTPSDVADFMVRETLRELPSSGGSFFALDCSCGTGVYLVAMLRRATFLGDVDPLDFAVKHLHGIDISVRSVESCAFLLLDHCLASVSARGVSPWAAWHALRLNLAAADSLKLKVEPQAELVDELRCRTAFKADFLKPGSDCVNIPIHKTRADVRQPSLFGWEDESECLVGLGRLFPEMSRGCDLLVGNPPYSELGNRDDRKVLVSEYSTLKHSRPSGNENVYLLFVEMMWRLTKPGNNSASLVIPLSIAYHQGSEYRACRQSMSTKGGTWRCAFFDREPHALFGEDVKTRNAILFRRETSEDPQRGSKAKFETGPLRKWTSRTRIHLFDSISFTPLGSLDIAKGIPKLDGVEPSKALTALLARHDSLSRLCQTVQTLRQSDAFKPGKSPRAFVPSTAYNFLNVYRELNNESGCHPVSENSVHCLGFAEEAQARVAFALLSSRLVYWLWHVLSDGFHVARSFLKSIPFQVSSFTDEQLSKLQIYGFELWADLQDHRIVSLNRGKSTIAFRPLAFGRERYEIDAIILEAAGLHQSMLDYLKSFVVSTVIVDHTDARRQHLVSHFQRIESERCPAKHKLKSGRKASSPRKSGGNTPRRSGI